MIFVCADALSHPTPPSAGPIPPHLPMHPPAPSDIPPRPPCTRPPRQTPRAPHPSAPSAPPYASVCILMVPAFALSFTLHLVDFLFAFFRPPAPPYAGLWVDDYFDFA